MTAIHEWEAPYHQTAGGLWVPGEEPEPPPLQALDLFAGCGGFSLGMQNGGINVVAAAEWEKNAAETYLVNLGARDVVVEADDAKIAARLRKQSGTNEAMPQPGACRWFWCRDIQQLTGDIVRGAVGPIDIVFGSPPCQGMSPAGKRDDYDPRNDLTFQFVRLVEELRPRAFVMENVPQLLTVRKGALYDEFERTLAAAGYTVAANVVNACDYGVPQHRRRAIVTGNLEGCAIAMPAPTHWPRVMRPNGERTYIGGRGAVVGPGGEVDGIEEFDDGAVAETPTQMDLFGGPPERRRSAA